MHPHGSIPNGTHHDSHHGSAFLNGAPSKGAKPTPQAPEPPLEELERELPVVREGQVPVALVIDRLVQDAYANLTEMADT